MAQLRLLFMSAPLGPAPARPGVGRMKRALKVAVALSMLLAVYVGVFSYRWMSAKRTVAAVNGRRHVEVQVHQGDLMYHTESVWKPAFWFMEHVGGYRYVGYIAAMEDSALVYEK